MHEQDFDPFEFDPTLDEADRIIHTLRASNSPGRFSLDSADGPDLTRGQSLAILVGGVWIEGGIEYGQDIYVNMGMQYPGEPQREPSVLDGYYFRDSKGGFCGLMVGMSVKIE